MSTKTVSPTITAPGSITLTYNVKLINTGAWTATAASLLDVLPTSTTYISGSLQYSDGAAIVHNGVLSWTGQVGFDSTVEITFSVKLDPAFSSGQVVNSAIVSDTQLAAPITLTAVTTVTDIPILYVTKSSLPRLPGPDKPLYYTLLVANHGQAAANLPITVTDRVPLSTTLLSVGPDGSASLDGDVVTWTRRVTLALGQTTAFTFSVTVDDVPSGTVITNDDYQVASPETGVSAGKPYTLTVIDPILLLSKHTWPEPPGSNRDMIYTLTLVNLGSLATDLVISDVVPAGVQYANGGSLYLGVVYWTLPSLDTGQTAEFTYTVSISDVMDVSIVNSDYAVCARGEGVCQPGKVLTSVVQGPTFEVTVIHEPIAKKPGGGGGPVTPTMIIHNLGPGSAIDAVAYIEFGRISVSTPGDLEAIPSKGTFYTGPDCGDKCNAYVWIGDLAYNEVITFTTTMGKDNRGRSTIGGEEGTHYTTTVVITDALGMSVTEPVSGTAIGRITHLANLIPIKSAPSVIGRGQLMTYTISVWNSGMSTDEPPMPRLWEVLPENVSVVRISDGGLSQTLSGTLQLTVISWTLPALSTGDRLSRWFTVQVDDDLVSGTLIVNDDYRTYWYENDPTYTGIVSQTGKPVTTTVIEVGLIDSYKEVTPRLARPGAGNVLTYYVHIVNSGPLPLEDVAVYDILPWQASTYQRNAVASAGQLISDIVTLRWTGDVGAFSQEVITLSVLVDPFYRGPLTNTAVISHPDLLEEVTIYAVAYVTDRPELRITKSARPEPVDKGANLEYTIRVSNLGQDAHSLVITDVIPANTEYVAGGLLDGTLVRWDTAVLEAGQSRTFTFLVKVLGGSQVLNADYAVTCAEGVSAVGEPLVTRVHGANVIYLPLVAKNR